MVSFLKSFADVGDVGIVGIITVAGVAVGIALSEILDCLSGLISSSIREAFGYDGSTTGLNFVHHVPLEQSNSTLWHCFQ